METNYVSGKLYPVKHTIQWTFHDPSTMMLKIRFWGASCFYRGILEGMS
jgi:hypothetical protein